MPQVAIPLQEQPKHNPRAADPLMPAVAPEMHEMLWRVLQLHRERRPAGALLLWPKVTLPPHTAAYKPMAMAVAEMQQNNLPAAERLMREARTRAPRDPLIAFFTGVLRMEQAGACRADSEGVGAQFAAYMPWEANEQRAMLELAAIMEFRDAIEWADEVNFDIELMPDPLAANLGPLVTDLMTALGADNFVGKAHSVLGDLLLRRGALTEAEQHIDAAVAAGLPALFGYEDLGLLYELQGRHADVLRVYGKNFQQNCGPYLQQWKELFD
jgi:tetratricopeptide (TPR) repeat protein